MKKLVTSEHKKRLLDIIFDKLNMSDNWVVDDRRYFNKFVFEDDECFITIIYSKIYNKIEFYNNTKGMFIIFSIGWFNRNKLKNKLNTLVEIKQNGDIENILNFDPVDESQTTTTSLL